MIHIKFTLCCLLLLLTLSSVLAIENVNKEKLPHVITESDVIDLLKRTNNENPIFHSEYSLERNIKFKFNPNNLSTINSDLKNFLEKINLSEVYGSEIIITGKRKINQNVCEKIYYKNNFDLCNADLYKSLA